MTHAAREGGTPMMRAVDKRELAAAIVAVVLGLAILLESSRYAIGTIGQMGPGLFPTAIGVMTVVLGLIYAVLVLRRPAAEHQPVEIDWRPLLMVPASLLVFALALLPLGLACASLLLVAVASLAQPGFRPKVILGVSLFMIVATGAIFVYGLGMPLQILPRL